MRRLSGLSTLAGAYQGFIVDLWGVIHDGVSPYKGAVDCLRRLQGRPVLLLSNAPRRAEAARVMLRSLGIDDPLYTAVLTSGEATWLALFDRTDPWFKRLGRRVYHIGPERDRNVMEGLGLERVSDARNADFVINTGPDDVRNPNDIADFTNELLACLNAGLPMICANPDIEVVRGGVRVLCAGALALFYEARGGEVKWIGKPDPDIYMHALDILHMQPTAVLAIGDSLRTDIAGAAAAAIDSVWVTGGVDSPGLNNDPEIILKTANLAKLAPIATMERFQW